MKPYSSDTHRVPTINVNLRPCAHPWPMEMCGLRSDDHRAGCPGAPILIPCPIPRSVTFEVRLGECECVRPALARPGVDGHRWQCPARPVRVSCSISGKTWEESEVSDVEIHDHYNPTPPAVTAACRERWALVKALVLGRDPAEPEVPVTAAQGVLALFKQRDAVFSALADMARADKARADAWLRVPIVVRHGTGPVNLAPDVLEWYVEHLIEQVGVLP